MVQAADTGLLVQVYRGPVTPVTQVGVENAAPVAGASVRVLDLTGKEVRRAATNLRGESVLTLAPGNYQIEVLACAGVRRLPEVETVIVKPQTMTKIRLDCDTGLR